MGICVLFPKHNDGTEDIRQIEKTNTDKKDGVGAKQPKINNKSLENVLKTEKIDLVCSKMKDEN